LVHDSRADQWDSSGEARKPNELVTPQSYGGTRGPSTAFLAMADLTDLQVEIDLNESDTPKVHLNNDAASAPRRILTKVRRVRGGDRS